jgi:hypothetical protein
MPVKLLYTIWVLVISSTDGHVIEEYVGSQPMTLERCNISLIEKGPIPVHDGKAVVAMCRKVESRVSL